MSVSISLQDGFFRSVQTAETVGTITGSTLDFDTGNVFSNAPSANATVTVTWPASVDWAGGAAPDAPASGATNVYSFYTQDGGTTYYGFLAGAAMG